MPVRRLILSISLCFALAPGAGRAQAQEADIPSRLTVEDAIRLALIRNPSLAAARNEVQALEGDVAAANKRLNPILSLQEEAFPISTHPGPFFNSQEITLRLDYEIERGGRRQLRTEALEAQRSSYQDRVRRTRMEVQRAFARALLAKSNMEAAQSILIQVEEVISLNRVRFSQGEISALELNRMEVEKLRFQDDVFQSDLMLRNTKSSLLALLNAPDLSGNVEIIGALEISDQIPEPGLPPRLSLQDLRRMAWLQRPDLAAILQDKNRADTESLLQRAIRSPNIIVGGGYKRNAADNSLVFGVTIPLKIFNRNEGEIQRAEAEQARAANLITAVRTEVELEIQQAFNAVEINRRRVDYIRTQHMKKVEATVRAALASYNLGGATLMDYLDAQRIYRDALRTYNQALFDERISVYELANSIS
jgi:cobalt-zinc-cadmium efflux system outer membrane protein